MDNLELQKMIQRIPSIKNFQGIFASDQLPTLDTNFSLILNTDPSYLSGQHWTAIFRNKHLYYFDSLAQKPPSSITNNYKINFRLTFPVQSNYSINCGYYCVLFLFLMSINCNFEETICFLKSISDSYVKNICIKLIK